MASEWQLIDSQTPKDRPILVSDGESVASSIWDLSGWCASHSFSEPLEFDPTHWRDCPEPPNTTTP